VNVNTIPPKQSNKDRSLHIGKPAWLKTKIPTGKTFFDIKKDLRGRKLYTVCEEAKCPNIGECWNTNTATFMLLGGTCTRACRFCNIATGNPNGWLDQNEAKETAESIQLMGLKYVVLTMVDRDDLADGGAAHVAEVINKIRELNPAIVVELLAGDFRGEAAALAMISSSKPEVFAHNIETVARLSPRVRDRRADYQVSLEVLSDYKKRADYPVLTKSALMLGLGETEEEVVQALRDLRAHDVDFITIGQYMRPSKKHLSIKEWVHPDQFAALAEAAKELGFKSVASGPLVRSSYRAREFYQLATGQNL